MNTFEFSNRQTEAISRFIARGPATSEDLKHFLREWAAHPDYEVEYTDRVIDSLVDLNVDYHLTLDLQGRSEHLSALVKAVEIAFRMKRWEWDLQRKDFWRGYPMFFAALAGMITDLEAIRYHAAKLTPVFTPRVMLVEGESEAEFIQAIQVAAGLADLSFQTFVMGGSGALGSLAAFAAEKRRTGTKIYISFDADGNGAGAEQRAAKLNRTLSPDGVFVFERDFESSFPPDVLAEALGLYGVRVLNRPVPWSTDQVEALLQGSLPFVKALEQETGESINKRMLGGLLAEALINRQRFAVEIFSGRGWVEPFEIGKFLAFLTQRSS